MPLWSPTDTLPPTKGPDSMRKLKLCRFAENIATSETYTLVLDLHLKSLFTKDFLKVMAVTFCSTFPAEKNT